MKLTLKLPPGHRMGLWLSCLALLVLFAGCKKVNLPPSVSVTTIVSGLQSPMGIESDKNGNIWVSQGETTNNDGAVWLIKPNGKKYLAIKNLSAFVNPHSNEPQGTSHLMLDNGFLYVLSGNYLYHIDVSHFNPGDKPINAAKLPYEDIGAFVLNYPFINDADDTHPYNLTKGPGGDIYIADAGANAILHRHARNRYSVLAEIPGWANPTPVGPPQIQAVPTSVFWDGSNFLVTTLSGFPFVNGLSVIYQVSRSGSVSVYQRGFTTLVDMARGFWDNHVVVKFGNFGPRGFEPNTGALLWANGSIMTPLVEGLNMPVGIKQHNDYTWFVTSLGDGTIKKVTYK